MTTTESAPPRIGAVGRGRASVEAIETLATIRGQGREVATDDERRVLAGFAGWGPLAPAFAPKDGTWEELNERIRAALPAEDVELGSRGTYMAFYTPEDIARTMWGILGKLGFTGGEVVEPGCGAGVFMRTAPEGAHVTGIDRDTTAASIARLLNPGHTVIHKPFEEARLVDGYAAAIGNVPFGNVKIHDPNAPREVRSIHDYFIWRTVKLLAPGGIAVLLTSRYTMDKEDYFPRQAIGKLADLIGAVRLPTGALTGGGTQVVADMLVLRRREIGDKDRGFSWHNTERGPRYGYDNPISTYWDEFPDHVLGDMGATGRGQHGMTIEVLPRPGDPEPAVLLSEAGESLAQLATVRKLRWVEPVDVGAAPSTAGLVTKEGWHNGSLRLIDNAVSRVEGGRLVPVARVGQELRDLLALRDLAVQLVKYESNHEMGDALIAPLRGETARAYARYVRRYGALNRGVVKEGKPDPDTGEPTYTRRLPTVMSTFRKDPDAALVFALEVYSDETQKAGPAPILKERQNRPAPRPTGTKDPAQALAWCLNFRGGVVDLPYIAQLLGIGRAGIDTVPALLGDAVYQDPGSREWQTAEEYLSGNVRRKLEIAKTAAIVLPEFQRNVDALESVLPPWLGPGEIGVKLGAPWIPADDVAQFVRELLGYDYVTVTRIPQTGQWEVTPGSNAARELASAMADWGTPDKDAFRLIELALNGRVPIVTELVEVDGREVERRNPDASLAASEKQARIAERFIDWLWEDGERTDRLVDEFNTKYNCLVARKFSGEHITVDGIAPWFKPYLHQLEWVARAIATPAALCGLPVGSGKTAMMAMTAVKLKQLGLVRKPMVVVPNHLLEQIDREFRQLFPAARILSASAATIAEGRRSFNARVATQDWDIVLVTHSAFNVLAVSPQTDAAYKQEEIADLEEALRDAAPDGELQGRMVKNLAKRKDNLLAELAKLKERAHGFDLGVTFESTGVDFLLIDEAHYYKNLAVPVRTDGFSVRPSKRATALETKLRYLKGRGTGRYAALFTGTPVSNTMLELYVVLRYLMQDELRAIDLGNADAWAAMFVRFVTSVDVTIDGGQFRLVTKPAEFINAPELRMMLSQVADIRTAEQLGLKRPQSTVETVVIQPTAAQRAYSAQLVERAEAVKRRGPFGRPEPGEDPNDNMLAICGDGRRMATDPALVGLDDDEPNKLHAVAANILRIWRADKTALQIGFCDVGTPNAKKGTQTYGRLRQLLVDGGMPKNLIRFIHDAKGDGDKAAMFSDCRAEGKVAVILGSTDKLGVGTNIQRRVAAMHHIDAPWRPADVEQRDGRGLRPGNLYKLVRIYRYVVERTFDAYSWQLLTRKIGFISQVVSGQVDRTVEDISADVVDSYAAVKAAATGQPLLLEKAAIDAEIKRLRGIQKGHQATVGRLRRDIARRSTEIGNYTREAEAWDAIAAAGDADAIDETAAEQLHEFVAGFRNHWRLRDARTFGGLQVTLDTWQTLGDRKNTATHPVVRVRGSADVDWWEIRAYSYWTPQRIGNEFIKLIRNAADKATYCREQIAKAQHDNAQAEVSASRPFAEADQLTANLARLDQIEAALHAAALKEDTGDEHVSVPEQRRPVQELEPVAPERIGDTPRAAAPAPAPEPDVPVDTEPDTAPVSEPVSEPVTVPDVQAAVLAAAVESGRVVIGHIGPPAPAPEPVSEPDTTPVIEADDEADDEDDDMSGLAALFGGLIRSEEADTEHDDTGRTARVFAALLAG